MVAVLAQQIAGALVTSTAEFGVASVPRPPASTTCACVCYRMSLTRTTLAYLMTAHFTYREMAEKLGVASSTISEDVKVIRERWRERAVADYTSHLAEELAKLDLLEHELLPMALSGGPKGGISLRAVDRVLAIRDRRARMLGLDAPSKVEATFKVELVVRALEDTLVELGIDDSQVRPVLGRRLRELDAAP
jgi:hypothetical protein